MKKIRIVAALLAAATVASPAFAHEVKYFANLSGAAEAAPNDSSAIGSVMLTIDLDLSTMKVDTTFSGLTGTVTAAHIHCCTATPAAGSVGVASPVPSFPGFPSGVKSGTYTQIFDMTQSFSYNPAFMTANGGTVSSAFNALLTGLDGGKAYLNVHTSAFTGGEIRGFLAPVPEPETWAMLMGGLGLIGWASRRGQRAAV